MTNSINNNVPASSLPQTTSTTATTRVGTPNADTVNALQTQLDAAGVNPTAPVNTANPSSGGITSEDMKLFIAEMNKFCINQGIATTPKATRD
jgi:hypothetical protein